MENGEDRVKFWKTPRLPFQIPDKYKMSTVEVFETYKSRITDLERIRSQAVLCLQLFPQSLSWTLHET